jgi:glycosyltransferase involved in cell wall biosynthesis
MEARESRRRRDDSAGATDAQRTSGRDAGCPAGGTSLPCRGMRVGFDVSALSRPHSRGVERVVQGLVDALERRAVLEVVRLAPDATADLRRWRQRELSRAVTRHALAGLHSFTSAFPLFGRGARVQTIHELPWRHGVAENAGLRHRLWASLATRRATRIVCPSEHVARDLAASRCVARERVQVIPWGVPEGFAERAPAGTVDEVVLERHRLGTEAFVLAPGAVRAKKDLAALLRGLSERKRRGASALVAVVTGPETAELRADLGLASRLGLARWTSTLGELEPAELPPLCRLASAVVLLSRSEGFGFPVLEAMASGTPVLVPLGSAQAELAGEAGIFVDPASAESVADGLERALSERARLAALGIERARAFTWQAAAERVEALWGAIA